MSVSKATRKSSRKAMAGRNKKRRTASPSVIHKGDQLILLNRQAKRIQASIIAHASGSSAVQAAQQKRKDLAKTARRAARQARKETQKAMRA